MFFLLTVKYFCLHLEIDNNYLDHIGISTEQGYTRVYMICSLFTMFIDLSIISIINELVVITYFFIVDSYFITRNIHFFFVL